MRTTSLSSKSNRVVTAAATSTHEAKTLKTEESKKISPQKPTVNEVEKEYEDD